MIRKVKDDGARERWTEFNLKLEFRRKITETGDGLRPGN